MTKKRELLFSITKEDFEVQTFYSGGPGGQNQNKRMTGVRIIHKESGAVGESREERSQLQNRKNALEKLTKTPKFRMWLNSVLMVISTGKTVDQLVDEDMKPENIKVEGVDEEGRWTEIEL
jgi:hypothetical protein